MPPLAAVPKPTAAVFTDAWRPLFCNVVNAQPGSTPPPSFSSSNKATYNPTLPSDHLGANEESVAVKYLVRAEAAQELQATQQRRHHPCIHTREEGAGVSKGNVAEVGFARRHPPEGQCCRPRPARPWQRR